MKTVGVIKATFNQAEYAADTLLNIKECLNGMTHFFIRDDCSSDQTYELLAEGRDAFVHVNRNLENLGVRKNSKRLLDDCETDYVAFSGGDDFICPATLGTVMNMIDQTAPDIIFMKVLRIPVEKALLASRLPDGSFDKTNKNPLIKNGLIFSENWRSMTDLLDASAVVPGLVWLQGTVIKKTVVDEAGYLEGSEVDDWGLMHNIALLNKNKPLNCVLLDAVFGVVGDAPASLGRQINQQFSRQINAIHSYWHPSYKKAALLNVIAKKINTYRESESSYDEVIRNLKKIFGNLDR